MRAGSVLEVKPREPVITKEERERGKTRSRSCATIYPYRSWSPRRQPGAPLPSPPVQATTTPSIARSGRGKGKKKKVWAKHSRNALPAGAGRGAAGAGRPGGTAGRGAAQPDPGGSRPGRGPSMAEPLLRKTFSRLRGREKLPRKKSDAKERGEWDRGPEERVPRPARSRGGLGAQGESAGGAGGAPRSPLQAGVGDPGREGVLEGRGCGERGADRYLRVAQDASAADSLGGPGGGLAPDRKWGQNGEPGERREEGMGSWDTGAQSRQGAPRARETQDRWGKGAHFCRRQRPGALITVGCPIPLSSITQ